MQNVGRRNNLHIAIIDSGVELNHPALQGKNIHGYRVNDSFGKCEIVPHEVDVLGHGTAICNIICASMSGAKIDVYSVSGNGFIFNLDMLLCTLNYIASQERDKYDIINLSMGTYADDRRLKMVCEKIEKNGTIIVSAFDNAGAISFPAAYEFVIGVDSSDECIHNEDYIVQCDSMVNVLAKGGVQRVAWNSPSYVIRQGASFAAAHVTVMIAKILTENSGIDGTVGMIKFLEENAGKVRKNNQGLINTEKCSGDFVSEIKKVIMYPFNKELHNLLNMKSMLHFSIVNIAKTRYSLQREYVDIHGNHYQLTTVKDCKWSEADTLILGHIDKIEDIIGTDELDYVLEECRNNNLRVFTFDEYGYERAGAYLDKEKIYRPSVNYSKYMGKKLYKLSTPVLGILGTTSSQGKFHLLLALTKAFKEFGYTVGVLGTEPTSELFGTDEVFPYGYNSLVHLSAEKQVGAVNHIMHRLDQLERDLILFSAQSGVCPMLYNNIGQLDIEQHSFLLGAMPDAAILCINAYDEDAYIHRSIQYIESLTMAKVVALCLYPLHFKNDWYLTNGIKVRMSRADIEGKITYLKSTFKLPVFLNGKDEDMEEMVRVCEEFFS